MFLFIIIFCSCETKKKNGFEAKIRKGDFPAYKLWECKNKHCLSYNADTLIELYPGPNRSSIEKKTFKGSYYEKIVYGKNLKIMTNGYWFREVEIGTHNYYNQNGTLIKQVNLDDGFDITIEDLRKICLKKYKIDINDPSDNNIEITKEKSFFRSSYIIKILLNPLLRETIKVNGKTGKIISVDFYDIEG